MRTSLEHQPTAAILRVAFERPGEAVTVATDALVTRDPAILERTTVEGGRAAQTTFTSTAPGQQLTLAPPFEGAILAVPIADGAELFIDLDALLGTSSGVSLDTTWPGASRFFGAKRLLGRAWGAGEIWLGACGGVLPVDVGADPAGFTAHTGNVLAFTQGLRHEVREVPGLRSPSGPARAAVLSGQGRVWLQTRRPSAQAALCHPFRGVGGGRAE